MVATIPTAIIGTGKVAHIHARALTALPESRLVAVFDRDRRRAQSFAARYGAKAYWDLDLMLAESGATVASVCTPHPTHPDIAVACAERGVHVLVEKPLAVDLAGADRAIEAAQRAGVRLGVISQRRWYPPVQRMKAALEAGRIGHPALGIVNVLGWRDHAYYGLDPWRGRWDGEGGGVLVNQAVHQLDLLLWFMGPVSQVSGFLSNVNHPAIDVEDTAVAAIRFASGALGSVVASNSQRPRLYARVHIHGSSGASVGVQTDGGAMFVAGVSETIEPAFNDLWTIPGDDDHLAAWSTADREAMASVDITSYYHALQIRDFLMAVHGGREPAVTGIDGRNVVELFTAIYGSDAHGAQRRDSVSSPAGEASGSTKAPHSP